MIPKIPLPLNYTRITVSIESKSKKHTIRQAPP